MSSILTNGQYVENLSRRTSTKAPIEEILNILETKDDHFPQKDTSTDLKYYFVTPPPLAQRIFRTPIVVIAVSIVSLIIYSVSVGPFVNILRRRHDYALASTQSNGFFRDISRHDWKLMQKRVKESELHHPVYGPNKWIHQPEKWYANNWDATFKCYHERKIGGLGDGGKWVCDPHRIKQKRGKCLIYSWGSTGVFDFEEDIRKTMGKNKCEIHVFEPFPEQMVRSVPEYYHFHPWGLKSENSQINSENFKTLAETYEILGHKNRVIDIFKIDCEHCEWTTYLEWMKGDAILSQILVEVHTSPSNYANPFFESLLDHGYVIFHKEPNTQFGGGKCVEFGFLRLNKSFFD